MIYLLTRLLKENNLGTLIGLSGYAQSGKDTVANYLVNEHGFIRLSFADNIRNFLYEVNPIVEQDEFFTFVRVQELVDANGWDIAKVTTPEIRTLLQKLGVGARKVFGDTFWVDQVFKVVMANPDNNYVITDVRFQNEATALSDTGGVLWRIERAGVGAANDHISEHDLDNWTFDTYLHNSTTIEDLQFSAKISLQKSK